MTYEDNPKAHIRAEFGFDVTQVAKNRYTSDRYHDFIGFEISKPVLERAFLDTYGIPFSEVISNEDLAVGTFRRAISNVIPEMTRVALIARRKEIVAETPNFRARQFRYYLSRTNYQKEWGRTYRRPGFGTRVLAFFLKFMPKVGPFKALDFKIPTQQTEDLYIASVDRTVENYTKLLHENADGKLQLANTDFDTGRDTRAGEYGLTDKTYARLLDQLAGHNFDQITPELRSNISAFYSDPNAPLATKTTPEDQRRHGTNWKNFVPCPNPRPEARQLPLSVAKLRARFEIFWNVSPIIQARAIPKDTPLERPFGCHLPVCRVLSLNSIGPHSTASLVDLIPVG